MIYMRVTRHRQPDHMGLRWTQHNLGQHAEFPGKEWDRSSRA
jgi:hypothetical protein